ncbi:MULTISPECIES: ATP-binding protein [Bacillus cereus group]|uniref:ATP-binding protein n=1 Tax=Bacillus cereus group TaxID=86661 RepID=UPI0022E384A3|nr:MULTISPECIES: ATP-binding protein [unclassified Bacillus cereus group]MDA2665983.1 ATP-binding protein [Bacillus cereus group sp. Bc032]MDA2676705.1 ATP-binding protein [Bacillus cereus group sp. Bc031]MDA2682151.1 ATP-binding protein [Bacillus cereus group sp. Bc029]MDA2687682.1 ATP-binding protein [Bacillus cereus group sp. Bc030]MDA2743165.1 ATP-binding protein [Bacillus cereus group sp. Bc011]
MRSLEKTNNLVLKGDFEEANYKAQVLSEYDNNPFIEALPPIFDEDDVLERFMVTPRITEQDKQSEMNIRYHVLKRVKNFIQPLPIHFEVERRLSTLIRRGYLARNPLDKTFLERIRVLHQLREDEEEAHKYIDERLNYIRSTADSLSIIGISGIGKTTAIERLLLMYPQVIKHEVYKGQAFNRTQIVWLKIDCPYDGSLSTMCKGFFKAIDDLLGTRYLEKYGYLNRVTSTMLLHMTSLASMYGIGVLVIDEIQHLLHSKNDQEEMLNFFVTLSNTVGIPTVLIGTSKAQQLFKGNFRQARRAASDGAIIWDRMAEDSEEWEFFLETLWELQCLKTSSELTGEIKKTFYEECQGITSVAVNLFILAQERALFDESNENEVITSRVLKKTAKGDMKIIQPMLNAIRKNDLKAMYKYEDIMINLDDLMINHKQNTEYEGKIKAAMKERQNTLQYKRQDTIESLSIEVASLGIFDALDANDIRKLIIKVVENKPIDSDYNTLKLESIQQVLVLNEKKKEQKSKNSIRNVKLLPLLKSREQAIQKKKHSYELLAANGYMKNPLEEFY